MSWLPGHRVRHAEWSREYKIYAETISDKTGVNRKQLDRVVEQFMKYGILPDEYESY